MKRKIKLAIRIFIFLMIISFLLPKIISAASLTVMSDRMTRHAPLTVSDHEIKFTTPSGVGDSGQYIRILFDSGFDLSNIDYTDIDLMHGAITGVESDETLDSIADITSWGVNIGVNNIDFSHPTNNLNGDILPGDKIVIRIGFSANGGDQQIINPAIIGSKIITLTGNYGDSGKLAVAIFQDQVGVGGETSGLAPVAVVLDPPFNILTNQMDLSWSQNLNSDFANYQVYYSTSPGLTDLTGTLFSTITNQTTLSLTVTGLNPNTIYYYKVYVFDTEGLKVPSNEVSAKTNSSGSGLPPQPPVPTVSNVTCPVFKTPEFIEGTRSPGTSVFVNYSNSNVTYPGVSSWEALVNFVMGSNVVNVFVQDGLGQTSNTLSVNIFRWEIGDTNGSDIIDDFDLAGIAWHWQGDWCQGDFNKDDFIDDFDLAGLAAHWDNVY